VTLRSPFGTPGATRGAAFRSTDGGLTYTAIDLGAPVYGLLGLGFVTNATVLLLGDSSQVFRVDLNTGAVARLGAAQGIPQAVVDNTTRSVLTFAFRRARFDAAGQIGFIIGTSTLHRPGIPDVIRGVILMSSEP
jgi:hypothetical protein